MQMEPAPLLGRLGMSLSLLVKEDFRSSSVSRVAYAGYIAVHSDFAIRGCKVTGE